MINQEIQLTEKDRIILDSYKEMVVGLGSYLGKGYEIILHSLESFDHSIIQIINGHYSGRSKGSPITDFALSMLNNIKEHGDKSSVTYFNRNKKNEILKSTTIPLLGENKRIIGLLCINFYTSISISDFVSQLYPQSHMQLAEAKNIETFSENIDDLLESTLNEIRENIMNDPSISSANKNKEIIIALEQRGIFNIKDSVVKIANLLNISKNTVYLHLRNLK